MVKKSAKSAFLLMILLGASLLGGCIVAPYPRYAYYGPGYYHPHYWWR